MNHLWVNNFYLWKALLRTQQQGTANIFLKNESESGRDCSSFGLGMV